MLQVDEGELRELEYLMQHAPKAYVRRKAAAIWNLAQGRKQREVATFLNVSQVSLRQWQKRYREDGAAGLGLRPGRGRRARAKAEEIESLLRQSPRNFGLAQTRWTLAALLQVAPSLRGFTPSGVWRAMRRSGLSYKRGQPLVTSPDPEYDQKRDS